RERLEAPATLRQLNQRVVVICPMHGTVRGSLGRRDMSRIRMLIAGTTAGLVLCGCGGGYSSGGYVPPNPIQYLAPTDNAFVAATDPNNPGTTYGPTQ